MSGWGSGQSSYAGGVGKGSGLKLAANSLDGRTPGSFWRRYTYDEFRTVEANLVNGGAAGGTAGNLNELRTGNIYATPYEYGIVGTQTITVPVLVAAGSFTGGPAGIDFGMDQTLADGVEVICGAKHSGVARGKHVYVSQTDKAFFAKFSWAIEDVSGVGPSYFGFKKCVAFGAVSTYTDFFVIGLTALNDGKVYNVTNLNNGGAVTTDTGQTWADAAQHTVTIMVDGQGVVTAYFDGTLLRTTPAFTFDSGDSVAPYFRNEHTTDVGGGVVGVVFESGFVAPQN